MALETKLYLAPLVELRNDDGSVDHIYKPALYLPPPDKEHPEETYHWLETQPATDPDYRFVELTADASVHAEIAADPDIVLL